MPSARRIQSPETAEASPELTREHRATVSIPSGPELAVDRAITGAVQVQAQPSDPLAAKVHHGDCPLLVDGLDDADMGEHVVAASVPVPIVGVVEEGNVARMRSMALVQQPRSLCLGVEIPAAPAEGVPSAGVCRCDHARAVVAVALAINHQTRLLKERHSTTGDPAPVTPGALHRLWRRDRLDGRGSHHRGRQTTSWVVSKGPERTGNAEHGVTGGQQQCRGSKASHGWDCSGRTRAMATTQIRTPKPRPRSMPYAVTVRDSDRFTRKLPSATPADPK